MGATNQTAYRRPTVVERGFDRLLALLVRFGLIRGHFHVLEVRARRSGRIVSLPVDPVDIAGQRYLVSPRGETQWVRNARAAGELVLAQGKRRRRYRVHELALDLRPPVLKEYLDRFAAEVQRFFPVVKGSSAEAFTGLAIRYPVFELQPLDDAAAEVSMRR
jgi:hypothetical protein